MSDSIIPKEWTLDEIQKRRTELNGRQFPPGGTPQQWFDFSRIVINSLMDALEARVGKTTADNCEEILKNIVQRCNKDGDGPGSGKPVVSFAPDWGGNSLTLYIGEDHTHVGDSGDDYPFEKLIDQLHDQLLEGKGLSFQIPIGAAKA